MISSINDKLMKKNFIVIEYADEDKKLNATYIISVARKLGCSIFLLHEDIMEVSSDELRQFLIPFFGVFL